jgi:phosphatidylinositol alpha-mannosyltransferase
MNESFGIVLLEAMASAVPVVASDIPGYRSVVSHGQEGFLCRPADARDMAKAILLILNDDTLRRQMGARGREKAQRFSWSNVAKEIEDFYFEAVKAKSRTRF